MKSKHMPEHDWLNELCGELLEALKEMTHVAEKAIVQSGTDAEFAAIRVEKPRAVIAKATKSLQ